MTTTTNVDLYESRVEPDILKRPDGSYHNLRTCTDARVLGALENLLSVTSENKGEECVVVPWLSPPTGRIVGYGIYTLREAEEIRKQSESERWGFPRFGRSYTRETIQTYFKSH
jgi:hypothetical protein